MAGETDLVSWLLKEIVQLNVGANPMGEIVLYFTILQKNHSEVEFLLNHTKCP